MPPERHAAVSPTAAQVIEIADRAVGAIIGTGGATIAEIKRISGAQVQVDVEKTDPRKVIVTGSAASVAHAVQMIRDIVASPLNPLASRFVSWGGAARGEPVVMEVPHKQAGIVIGRGGENIREITQLSGAHIQVSTGHASESETRSIVITGASDQARTPPCARCAEPSAALGPVGALGIGAVCLALRRSPDAFLTSRGPSPQVEAARRMIYAKLYPGEAPVWEAPTERAWSQSSLAPGAHAGCLPHMLGCAADPAAGGSQEGADAQLHHYGGAFHPQDPHMQLEHMQLEHVHPELMHQEAMRAHLAARFTAQAQHALQLMAAAAEAGDFGPAADPKTPGAGHPGVPGPTDSTFTGGGGSVGKGAVLETELSLGLAGLVALLADGPITELQRSGVEMHLARRPSGDGRHRVRLRGLPPAVEAVTSLLNSIDACARMSEWRHAHTPPEAAHHRYYAGFFETARLPYRAPRLLWPKEDSEAGWYESWARYWAAVAELGLTPDALGGAAGPTDAAQTGDVSDASGALPVAESSVPPAHEGQGVQHAPAEGWGAAEAALPQGWQTATTSEGAAYFYNTAKGETQWHRPTE
jgi:transcription antitermination factor NusA-like protein